MYDHLAAIMRGVNSQVFQMMGNRVVYGIFKGMEIKQDPVWNDGNASTKLLGVYEFELDAVVAKAIARKPNSVINIGCADGFYSIGFAKVLPEATIFAVDIDEASLWECRGMVQKNGVVERMQFHYGCHLASELDFQLPDGRLYFVDCEGHEEELLDKYACPALIKSDIIVECHEFARKG